jgi:hypothetical protein
VRPDALIIDESRFNESDPMTPRYDGYYLSALQRSEDWHAGVRMVSEYHRYLKLFEDGRWVCKDHPTPELDFPAYLGSVTVEAFEAGLAGHDPLDAEYDYLHQTGRFTQAGDRLDFVHRHSLIVMHEHRWELRVESAERLAAPDGVTYRFFSQKPESRRATSPRRD